MEEKLFPVIRDIIVARIDSYYLPPVEDIHLDSDFSTDLCLESIDLVDVLIACETQFSINLNDAGANKVHTIRDLIRFILEKKPELCDRL